MRLRHDPSQTPSQAAFQETQAAQSVAPHEQETAVEAGAGDFERGEGMKFDAKRIAEARERCEKATKGPWTTKPSSETYNGFAVDVVIAATASGKFNKVYAKPPGGSFPATDQNLIANARQDLPDALDDIEELLAAIQYALKELDSAMESKMAIGIEVHDARDELRKVYAKAKGGA